MMLFTPKTSWFSPKGLWQEFWSMIWNLSEYTHIGLSKFSPWVFGQIMGCKKMERVDKIRHNKSFRDWQLVLFLSAFYALNAYLIMTGI